MTGFEAPIEWNERRPGDVRDAQFDSSLAKAELGWEATTSILEGMRETVAYFRERSTPAVAEHVPSRSRKATQKA